MNALGLKDKKIWSCKFQNKEANVIKILINLTIELTLVKFIKNFFVDEKKAKIPENKFTLLAKKT